MTSGNSHRFQIPVTVPLHSPNGRQMPTIRTAQGDCERAQFFSDVVVSVMHCSHHMKNNSAIKWHYRDVILGTMASHITSLTIVYSTVYAGADQRKHQSSASLAFVRGIHRGPVNSPHKLPVTRNMFSFEDVIMAGNVWHAPSTPLNWSRWPNLEFSSAYYCHCLTPTMYYHG